MHLLVLSAFRQKAADGRLARGDGLNAPFGAQCFPTFECRVPSAYEYWVSMHLLVLSAFRPAIGDLDGHGGWTVSMHLLVLSAFRQ